MKRFEIEVVQRLVVDEPDEMRDSDVWGVLYRTPDKYLSRTGWWIVEFSVKEIDSPQLGAFALVERPPTQPSGSQPEPKSTGLTQT